MNSQGRRQSKLQSEESDAASVAGESVKSRSSVLGTPRGKADERDAELTKLTRRAEAAEQKLEEASSSDELATVTAERDKLRKDAAAAEENVSRLEADLREARDASEKGSELEAEVNAARDRVTALEAQVSAPTGDADTDELRQKVASLETKVAALEG